MWTQNKVKNQLLNLVVQNTTTNHQILREMIKAILSKMSKEEVHKEEKQETIVSATEEETVENIMTWEETIGLREKEEDLDQDQIQEETKIVIGRIGGDEKYQYIHVAFYILKFII